ncbi:MAG: RHS repeat-associated core domain-containing protein [Firmicutes bacterium]|nr:RHS repeat-associated core domain-containing protein [Bacillota bacterium]
MKRLFYRICSLFMCLTLVFAQTSALVNENVDALQEEILSKIFEKVEYIRYDYNDNWHISVVKSGDIPKIWYFYDEQDQLIRENNKILNKTITYSYDCRGNIQNKKIYSFTDYTLENQIPENIMEYKYTNLDKLIDYNGKKITYDKFGNPLQYKNDWKFEWKNGRQLLKAAKSNNEIQYKYDNDGYRTQKIVNGKTTEFVYTKTGIASQKFGNNIIKWYCPEDEQFANFNYNGTDYVYIKNMLGDIIGIADFSGNIIVNYTYDSWGKLISITDENGKDVTYDESHIGYINPLRYRSYYYDVETKLYYLLSRYYDAETGRFLNEDDRECLKQNGFSDTDIDEYNNLYIYCYNNPINYVDEDGRYGTPIQWACAVIGGVAGRYFGDYVARKFGFVPRGKGWQNATNYWLIRSGVVVGGAVVGWFTGTAVMKVAAAFLLTNPNTLEKMPAMLRWFLGLDIGGKGLASGNVADFILSAPRVGRAQESDIYHRAGSFLSRSQLAQGKAFFIPDYKGVNYSVLLQTYGKVNNKSGIFEYIIAKGGVITHQLFKEGGVINGIANAKR